MYVYVNVDTNEEIKVKRKSNFVEPWRLKNEDGTLEASFEQAKTHVMNAPISTDYLTDKPVAKEEVEEVKNEVPFYVSVQEIRKSADTKQLARTNKATYEHVDGAWTKVS